MTKLLKCSRLSGPPQVQIATDDCRDVLRGESLTSTLLRCNIINTGILRHQKLEQALISSTKYQHRLSNIKHLVKSELTRYLFYCGCSREHTSWGEFIDLDTKSWQNKLYHIPLEIIVDLFSGNIAVGVWSYPVSLKSNLSIDRMSKVSSFLTGLPCE